MTAIHTPTKLSFSRPTDGTLLVRLAGSWTMGQVLPSADEVQKHVDSGRPVREISFDTNDLASWESGFLTFLTKVINQCSQREIRADSSGLSGGVKRLLQLASAVPEKKDARKAAVRDPFLFRAGTKTMELEKSAGK